jgi:hypothetical protein
MKFKVAGLKFIGAGLAARVLFLAEPFNLCKTVHHRHPPASKTLPIVVSRMVFVRRLKRAAP